MKTLSVGELRQNVTQMLDDVAAGETYVVTRQDRQVAFVTPATGSATVVPARSADGSNTRSLSRVALPDGQGVDAFLADLNGDRDAV